MLSFLKDMLDVFYFYCWRKIQTSWYDEEENNFKISTERSGSILKRTWNGDTGILSTMLLKIDHMIWNLMHYSYHKGLYILVCDFLENATDTDKAFIFHKIMTDYTSSDCESYRNFKLYRECFTDKKCTKFVKKAYGKYIYKNFTNYTTLCNQHDKTYYIKHDVYYNGTEYEVEQSIVFMLNSDQEILLAELPINFTLEDVQNIIGCRFNVFESMLSYEQIISLTIEDLPKLGNLVKEKLCGNRVTINQLFKLRRLIKKVSYLDSTNDKYFNIWKDVKDNQEEKIKEAQALYLQDRKNLYSQIFELMNDKGECWWD